MINALIYNLLLQRQNVALPGVGVIYTELSGAYLEGETFFPPRVSVKYAHTLAQPTVDVVMALFDSGIDNATELYADFLYNSLDSNVLYVEGILSVDLGRGEVVVSPEFDGYLNPVGPVEMAAEQYAEPYAEEELGGYLDDAPAAYDGAFQQGYDQYAVPAPQYRPQNVYAKQPAGAGVWIMTVILVAAAAYLGWYFFVQ